MVTVGGPMFEPAKSELCRSIFSKSGAHYNIYEIDSISAIRQYIGEEADELNLVIFSTSGVHGTYTTIEEIEGGLLKYGADAKFTDDWPEDYHGDELTVLIIHPRIVCMRYGCIKVTLDDAPYLKAIRDSSRQAFAKIGA